MPKGRLSEHHVQEAALHFLKSFYQQERGAEHVVARKEVVVKPEFGRGRADGLVTFAQPEGGTFVVSLEAKSFNTLRNMLYRYDDGPWFLHGAVAGILAASVAWWVTRRVGFWLWRWGVPVGIFAASAVAYLKVTAEFFHYKTVDVVRQLERYPADEQWVACSTDAFKCIPPDHKTEILNKCKTRNLGLLLVSPGAKCKVQCQPALQPLPKKPVDYLERYVRGDAIRKALELRKEQV